MERAGEGLARVCAELAPAGRVAVVCGRGNNGGDGLVTARLLRDHGREVAVLMLADRAEIQGDAKLDLERLPGPEPIPFDPEALDGAALIVDAILGTGFSGTPREPAAGAIVAINRHRDDAVIVACDVPSGVDASTGEVAADAVLAHATVTFHAAKPGLWIAPGKPYAGAVTVVDIGIPSGYEVPEPAHRADHRPRPHGAAGTRLCLQQVHRRGGARLRRLPRADGAPALAGMAAARAGAGYVTVAVPDSLVEILAIKLLEVMQVGLPERDGTLAPAAVASALERAQRVQSVVLGPGLGASRRRRRSRATWRGLSRCRSCSMPTALGPTPAMRSWRCPGAPPRRS